MPGATTTSQPYVYDPYDADVHETYPADLYAWMRDEQPLYRSERRDLWALSRFSDVQAASRDWQTFSSAGPFGVDLDGTGKALYGTGNFLEVDPPRHGQLRDIVRREFAPREVARMENLVAEEARGLFTLLRASGGGDAARHLCWQLAFNIVARLLAIPPTDQPHVADLLLTASARSPGDPAIPPATAAAAEELRAYMAALVSGRHKLRPGILATVAQAQQNGTVSSEEAPGIGMLFLGAAVETPAILAANALYLLARHPEQRTQLQTGLVGTEAAIEELLRYESPVQCLARTTTRDTELHGVDLPEGATVLLVYGAANRDDRRWADSNKLDITRPRQRHLAFGEGLHFCLGAPLARLEAKVVVDLVLRECPDYEVVGPVRRIVKYSDWGVLELPLVCERRPS